MDKDKDINNAVLNDTSLEQQQGSVTASGVSQADTSTAAGTDSGAQGNNTDALIDDVSNGDNTTNTSNTSPINSLESANKAFLEMLSGAKNTPDTNDNASENTNNEQAADTDNINNDSQSTVDNDSDNNNTDTNAQAADSPSFDESKITSLINDAIEREIKEGKLKDLSINDTANQVNALPDAKQKNQEDEPDEPDEEPELDINSDEFFEMFSDNPTDAIDKITNQRVKRELKPILEQLKPLLDQSKKTQENQKILDVIKNFGVEHPDFKDYNDDMIQILKEGNFPKDDINSYRNAYQTAKNNKLAQQVAQLQQQLAESEQNQSKTIDDYLHDQDSFNSLRQNESLKKSIIEDYIKELANGGSPHMITSGGSTQPNATPPDKINSFDEATNKFKSMLQG